MSRILLLISAALGASACASNTATSEGASETPAAAETEQKVRCYREPTTGFRTARKRVCVPVGDESAEQ